MTRRDASRLLAALALLVTLPGVAGAHSYKLADIAIGHVWAPPPEAGADGIAVYGPLLNRGAGTVRLVRVSSPAAAEARIRVVKDGETTWPDSIELAPNRPLALAPWRQHIWLSGLKQPVSEGDSVPLRLNFGEAGSIEVTVVVERAAGH